jgi:hypothetical protein
MEERFGEAVDDDGEDYDPYNHEEDPRFIEVWVGHKHMQL